MVDSAWKDQKLAAAHLLAAVSELKTMGCYALEYPKADPKWHIKGSRHVAKGYWGRACAADINRTPAGEPERLWFRDHGQQIAFNHGLSVTCGIYGYVENHSGANMHLHIDDGPWSNIGDKRGVFKTPTAARPVVPAWPVRTFQKQQGLVVDGIAGKLTVTALQTRVGMPKSEWDGIAGRKTWSAVQKRVGAVVDGIAGGETFYKLGVWIEGGSK